MKHRVSVLLKSSSNGILINVEYLISLDDLKVRSKDVWDFYLEYIKKDVIENFVFNKLFDNSEIKIEEVK